MTAAPATRVALEISCGDINRVFAPSAQVLVGRSMESAVPIADAGVSGRHLLLVPNEGGWTARDLSTTNGTFLGGGRFTSGVITPDWQTFELGGLGQGTLVRARTVVVSDTMARRPRPAAPVGTDPPPPTHQHVVVDGSVGVGRGSHTRAWTSRRQLRDVPVTRSIMIGREPSNDIVVEDLLVSRQHARLEFLQDGAVRIVDLGSVNGTFVDQRLASPAIELVEGSLVSVGNAEFAFRDGRLDGRQPTGAGAEFAVVDLTVPGRLDRVSFALSPRSFLAVLGTSGAGKSTLLKAITGLEPATSGSVRFDGRDLYANFRALRHRIGYVPQDDILHDQLTVDQSLRFGAELRFPDASTADRAARIDDVLRDLGLEAHRHKLVRELSGGQRKRVSVGLELLHRPALLILDEPTSGLDPGNERRLMTQLARLARSDEGRTVLVVTHSTESLHLCDQVLFLAKGGVTIYLGPPDRASASLGAADFPDAFARADEAPSPEALRQRFLASPLGASIRAVQSSLRGQPAPRPASTNNLTAKSTFARDLRIFVRRYVRLVVSDRKTLLTLALQAPIIAGMILVAASAGTLDRFDPQPGAGNVLMALVLGSIYAGASNAAREVVKERAILRREQNFGISLAAYLASKIVVLAVVVAIQAVVFVVIGTARQGQLGPAALLGSARIELFVVVALSGVSAAALGLLVSCLVSNSDKASTVLPMVLLAQFVLAGLTFSVDRLGVGQVSWLMSARWGFAGAASTVDFRGLGGCHDGGAGAIGPRCLSSWRHDGGVWFADMLALSILTAVFLAVAWVVLARADPANSLRAVRAKGHGNMRRRVRR